MSSSLRKYAALSLSAALLASTAAFAEPVAEIGIKDADYSLEALIEAAKKEPSITVVDATGKIVTMAVAFTAKYGVKATGVNMNGQNQEQVILRDAAANNVRTADYRGVEGPHRNPRSASAQRNHVLVQSDCRA